MPPVKRISNREQKVLLAESLQNEFCCREPKCPFAQRNVVFCHNSNNFTSAPVAVWKLTQYLANGQIQVYLSPSM